MRIFYNPKMQGHRCLIATDGYLYNEGTSIYWKPIFAQNTPPILLTDCYDETVAKNKCKTLCELLAEGKPNLDVESATTWL